MLLREPLVMRKDTMDTEALGVAAIIANRAAPSQRVPSGKPLLNTAAVKSSLGIKAMLFLQVGHLARGHLRSALPGTPVADAAFAHTF